MQLPRIFSYNELEEVEIFRIKKKNCCQTRQSRKFRRRQRLYYNTTQINGLLFVLISFKDLKEAQLFTHFKAGCGKLQSTSKYGSKTEI